MHHRYRTTRRVRVGLLGTAIALTIATATAFAPPPAAHSTVAVTRAATQCPLAAPGSVNNDGYADVAVGEPGNNKGRGSAHVFYGHPRSGLVVNPSGSARNDEYVSQAISGVPGVAEPGDAFGSATLLADLNGDGCSELIVGSPGENDDTGWVQVFFGSAVGLRTSVVQSVSLSAIPGAPRSAPGQRLGETLAAGDLDGDGYDDLVAGVAGLRVNGLEAAGGVAVIYGGPNGLNLQRSTVLTRDTPGIPGDPQASGGFGTAITVGSFDNDVTPDIAVSSTNGLSGGSVQLLTRTGTGFTGGEPIGPDTTGMPGDQDRFCFFGAALASGDVNDDGHADLAVGDPAYGCHDEETEFGMGAVVLLRGSPAGLTTTGSQLWTQDSPGVEGTARLGNVFGASLAMGPLDRGGHVDLAIGAPGDDGYGSVTLLLGSPDGLTTDGIGGTRYTQATNGIPGTNESGDAFGETLTAPFLQSLSQATLVIGTPGEDVGTIVDAGSITQLPMSASGPDPRYAKTITANTPGVRGKAGRSELFGGGVPRWG